MQSFVKAAIKVLELERRPLTAHEIVAAAKTYGFLDTHGLTPHKTLNARLSEHILKFQHESLVMRIGKAEYGLREWQKTRPEYVAKRRHLLPIEETILAFPAKKIRQFIKHDGVTSADLNQLRSIIRLCEPVQRAQAEERTDIIQLISSFLITYRGNVLSYRRSKRLPEKRLHDAHSLLFGGHITYEDQLPLFGLDEEKTLQMFMRRELDEEVRCFPPPETLHFKGFIFDSKTELGRQHIGLIFHVPMRNKKYSIGERGFLLNDKFESKTEVRAHLEEYDSWSRMVAEEYLNARW